MNNYQIDSLKCILAENFVLLHPNTVTSIIDKKTFLSEYMDRTRVFHGKYIIIKTISDNDPQIFLIEDQSDYLKYLDVISPVSQITIKKNVDFKIEEVVIDTIVGFEKYAMQIQAKEKLFDTWIKKNYPDETLEILQDNDPLLLERMKLYSQNN